MTESEAWAVARWDVGSCLRMVHKTKQVGFEPVFESLHSWSISYGGWDWKIQSVDTQRDSAGIFCADVKCL